LRHGVGANLVFALIADGIGKWAITRIAPTLKYMNRFNPDIHHRRSNRLKDYDYSQAGAYFVTVCNQGRESLFGHIADGVMYLNEAGRIVKEIWESLPERFRIVQLDQFMVMPNHFHGIIMLNPGAGTWREPDSINDCRGESCIRPGSNIRPDVAGEKGDHKDRPYGTADNSLGRVIQAFKSLTTHTYVNGVNNHGWQPFPGRLWQRNYYEHVIRNEEELNNVREYIMYNPVRWAEDENNPVNIE